MSNPDNTSNQAPPPPEQPAPPPQQGWQSQAQQPGPPPAAGGQPAGSGMPSWTSNITAQGTISGPGGLALADLPNRIIAVVIDFIILGIVGFIVGAILHPILGERISFGGIIVTDVVVPSLVSSLAVAAVMAAVSAGYFIYMWLKMAGATIGMRVLKLQVRDAASGGQISQDQAIKRWAFLAGPWALSFFYSWGIGFLISVLVLVYYIYLLVSAAQSPTRQGLHDKQANTVVAKVA